MFTVEWDQTILAVMGLNLSRPEKVLEQDRNPTLMSEEHADEVLQIIQRNNMAALLQPTAWFIQLTRLE